MCKPKRIVNLDNFVIVHYKFLPRDSLNTLREKPPFFLDLYVQIEQTKERALLARC